ncbi:MAG: serine hydrolase [Chloroflexi bacterium]|nr:serine hydrolase [Chloroflexota bacterium]
MQLKTKPIILSLIVIFGITILAFLVTSSVRYTSPTAVFQYIKTHPRDVAIVCLDPSKPQLGYFLNANEPFPLASTYKLVLLSAYANEVALGGLDPKETLPISELEKYYLPGTDGGAHLEFIKSLGTSRTSVNLDEVVDAMSTFGSNAATDYLISRLKKTDFPNLFKRLGLTQTSQPTSFLGLYLFINNHETGLYAEEQLSPEEIRAEQSRLADLFVNDPDWRKTEIEFITKPTNAAPLFVQKQVVSSFGVNGSANDISRILLAVYGNSSVFSSQEQTIMRNHLEWPMRHNPEKTKDFKVLASASGAWPAVLTSAWFAQTQNANARVLVVLYRNIPDDFWNTWISTFSHQQFENQVLSSSDCSLFHQVQ